MSPRRRHIALLFEYPTLNGGERSMLAAIGSLPRDEFEFIALAPAQGRLAEALRERKIRHVPFEQHDAEGTRRSKAAIADELVEHIHSLRPVLLHANSLAMGRLTGSIAEQLTIPTTAHLRDIIGLSQAAIADLNRNRRLFAVSQATRAFHVAQGLDPERAQVVYNGIDCERFRPRPRTGRLHRELDLPGDAFLVGTIGQIGLRKGQNILAGASAAIALHAPGIHYLLVGERHSSKAERVTFEQAVVDRFAEAGIGDRVHRLGYRDDVPALLNEIDLLVHPAHQEPLGRVLREAAAAGVPIIATAVGGTPEILEDGRSARLIPPGDGSALAAAMRALHGDAALRHKFATAARQRVCEAFEIKTAARTLAAAWSHAIDSSLPPSPSGNSSESGPG